MEACDFDTENGVIIDTGGLTIESREIENIFNDCLADESVAVDESASVKINCSTIVFDKEKLEQHKETVIGILEKFRKVHPESKDGIPTFIKPIEKLFQLGMGLGKVDCETNKDMTLVIPVGMPIYKIL